MEPMSPYHQFKSECRQETINQGKDDQLRQVSLEWMRQANSHKYSYHFEWMGRPIIQYPQDMIAMQELIWEIKPDLIIETGIAHGGSLIFSASILALLDDAYPLDPTSQRKRKVLGIDIDIRPHNRGAIESHPMHHRIEMIQGSSIDPKIITSVHEKAAQYSNILVCLDSNHTHSHVLAELQAYAPLVSAGSYCVVFDTIIEDFPKEMYPDRPWGPGDNPKTAIFEYLKGLQSNKTLARDGNELSFEIDDLITNKLLLSVAPSGFLKRI